MTETAALVRDAGGRAVAVAGDVSRRPDADRLVAAAVETFGGLDILVNNAATTRDSMFHTMTPDALEIVLAANVRTTFTTSQAAMPYVRGVAKGEIAQHGAPTRHRKIVSTASVVALTGNVGQWNYTAAKGAIVSVTKTMASELGPFGINVNAVAPGFVETRLTRAKDSPDAEPGLGMPAEQRARSLSMIAIGRLGVPEDIAAVTAFLASPDSDFVSGVTIPVTGGQFGGMG